MHQNNIHILHDIHYSIDYNDNRDPTICIAPERALANAATPVTQILSKVLSDQWRTQLLRDGTMIGVKAPNVHYYGQIDTKLGAIAAHPELWYIPVPKLNVEALVETVGRIVNEYNRNMPDNERYALSGGVMRQALGAGAKDKTAMKELIHVYAPSLAQENQEKLAEKLANLLQTQAKAGGLGI